MNYVNEGRNYSVICQYYIKYKVSLSLFDLLT